MYCGSGGGGGGRMDSFFLTEFHTMLKFVCVCVCGGFNFFFFQKNYFFEERLRGWECFEKTHTHNTTHNNARIVLTK